MSYLILEAPNRIRPVLCLRIPAGKEPGGKSATREGRVHYAPDMFTRCPVIVLLQNSFERGSSAVYLGNFADGMIL